MMPSDSVGITNDQLRVPRLAVLGAVVCLSITEISVIPSQPVPWLKI